MPQKLKRVLLIRTDRIGDVMLTIPAVSVVHQRCPDVEITFLTRDYTEPLLQHYRHIQRIVIYDPEGKHQGIRGHWVLAQELKNPSR